MMSDSRVIFKSMMFVFIPWTSFCSDQCSEDEEKTRYDTMSFLDSSHSRSFVLYYSRLKHPY
jgi:hypothetical protein